jgi:hypothetical protein
MTERPRIYRRFTVEIDYPHRLDISVSDSGVVRLATPVKDGPAVSLHASDLIKVAEMLKDAEVR